MCEMHAPVSPLHDAVPHAMMLCVNFRDLRRLRHDARLRCIIRVRGSFSFTHFWVIWCALPVKTCNHDLRNSLKNFPVFENQHSSSSHVATRYDGLIKAYPSHIRRHNALNMADGLFLNRNVDAMLHAMIHCVEFEGLCLIMMRAFFVSSGLEVCSARFAENPSRNGTACCRIP